MKLICFLAFGQHRPGDIVEFPDGAQASVLHYAEPGSPGAARAVADAAATGGPQPSAGNDPPATPKPAESRTAPRVPSAADITPKEGA